MSRIIKATMGMMMTLALFLCSGLNVSATGIDMVSNPYIILESYSVDEERIVPGEKFTLTLNLKNTSTVTAATNVLIDIENPYGVAPVYGTVSQKYVGDIAPSQSVQVSFEYDTWETITSNALEFSVSILADQRTNHIMLRIPAGADNPFNVLELTVPERVVATEMTSFSLSYRVIGKDSLNNVSFQVESSGEILGSSVGGNITAGATKNQNVSFSFPGAGEYVLDFYMKYQMEDGSQQSVLLDSKVINVEPKNLATEDGNYSDVLQEQESDNTQIMILVLGGGLILAIFIMVAVIMKKKR
ncbi:MAG: hypothetical protein IKL04_08950 [Lachnospiraceae bacterium]|nr:hypothetical protein [Lachnospiraceae bacterium]